jgi:hypothetical protein
MAKCRAQQLLRRLHVAAPAQIPACGTTAPGSCLGSDVQAPKGACRTRLSACDRRPRRCVRLLVDSATFPLARALPSPFSAAPMGRPLFEGCLGPLKRSDALHPSITGVPQRCPVRTWHVCQARCRASRVPRTVFRRMPEVSDPAGSVSALPERRRPWGRPRVRSASAPEKSADVGAPYSACVFPGQRFADTVTDACA